MRCKNTTNTPISFPFNLFEYVFKFVDYKGALNLRPVSLFFYKNNTLFFRVLQGLVKLRSDKELDPLFRNQVLRCNSLMRNLALTDSTSSSITLSDMPLLDISQHDLSLLGLTLDEGRANSSIKNQKYDCAFFQDQYHREAYFSRPAFGLVLLTCKVQHADGKYIPLFKDLGFLMGIFMERKFKNFQIFNVEMNLYAWHYLAKVPEDLVEKTLHYFGHLGALPNRDWQLQSYMLEMGIEKVLKVYTKIKPGLSKFAISCDLSEKIAITGSPIQKMESIVNLLTKITGQSYGDHSDFHQNMYSEQRHFYTQLLKHLIEPIQYNTRMDKQEHIQFMLTLQRMEDMLSKGLYSSYTNFLRIVEAIIDEIMILYVITNKDKQTAASIIESVTQFVTKTIGVAPQSATLRSSAMQSMWLSLQTMLIALQSKKNPCITMCVSRYSYFEMFIVIHTLFMVPLKPTYEKLRLKINSNSWIGETLSKSPATIYDIYVGNFESNVMLDHNQMHFTDISRFVLKQMNLRKQGPARPLTLIIDTTMSDFNAPYLGALLQQFQSEIDTGLLCVFAFHSGNKYFHAGTDKSLAALFYAYYNPEHFPEVAQLFQSDLKLNRIGDFRPTDPTILLTVAFMEYCYNEILMFSRLIRKRTQLLFESVIPRTLLNKKNYISIDTAQYDKINNCGGFITLRVQREDFHGLKYRSYIVNKVSGFLNQITVNTRDGFGFSETSQIFLENHAYSILRISIGTESLDLIAIKIQFMCDFLSAINAIMAPYRLDSLLSSHFETTVDTIVPQMKREISKFHFYNQTDKDKPIFSNRPTQSFFALPTAELSQSLVSRIPRV